MKKNPQKKHVSLIKKVDTTVEILGVSISGTRKIEVLKKMWLQRREMLHVATVNPEYIMEARSNPRFKSVLDRCLTVADGHGVVWASQILGDLPAQAGRIEEGGIERISGTELVRDILHRASTKGEKVFLLGGARGVAIRAAAEMSNKYPGLQIYAYEGAKSVRSERDEESSVTIARINAISPDYLLVAYGSPYQDLWIEENRPFLRVRVAMGVGGVFDEWAGDVRLSPEWLDQLGLKWLWRVVHEPWRWRRILRVFQFGLLAVFEMLKRVF